PTLDAGFLGHEARGAAGPSTSVRPAGPVQDLGSALPPLAAARYVHGEEVAPSPGRSGNAPPVPHHDGDVPRMGARRRRQARASFFALEQPFLKSPSDTSPVLNFAARIEFQDGKRKLATQDYHGRETAHLHGLTFAPSLASLLLEHRLRATVPEEPSHPLQGYVLDGQDDSDMGGTVRPLQAPWPGMLEKPKFVELYEACPWRGDHMSLLEWLRKTNANGEILTWIKKAHAKSGSDESGEKVIAAETVRIFNDKFFGQWMALNLPFRDMGELLDVEVMERAVTHFVLHASVLKQAPGYWTDDAKVTATLQLAGHRDGYIDNALAMLAAQRSLIQKYMEGALDKNVSLDVDQLLLEKEINDRVDRALAARDAQDPDEVVRLTKKAAEANSILVCTGPPGCGKTTVADVCLRRAERHPGIDVDTCHSAFLLHRPLQEALALLTVYDMVIVDEALQLSAEHFERLHEMWDAAGRCACLLLLGDPWQLPS
ncbi:pif1, partial [Symbiodinium pilosum]